MDFFATLVGGVALHGNRAANYLRLGLDAEFYIDAALFVG